MIANINDLAAHLGASHDTAKSVARRLYKDTSCGIGFEATAGGVSVAGYCEGFHGELPNHELTFPFAAGDFDELVARADLEGCAMWDELQGEAAFARLEEMPGSEQYRLYAKYITDNLPRTTRGGWEPVCFEEFISSEEFEGYADEAEFEAALELEEN